VKPRDCWKDESFFVLFAWIKEEFKAERYSTFPCNQIERTCFSWYLSCRFLDTAGNLNNHLTPYGGGYMQQQNPQEISHESKTA